jgi:hypothetical protein
MAHLDALRSTELAFENALARGLSMPVCAASRFTLQLSRCIYHCQSDAYWQRASTFRANIGVINWTVGAYVQGAASLLGRRAAPDSPPSPNFGTPSPPHTERRIRHDRRVQRQRAAEAPEPVNASSPVFSDWEGDEVEDEIRRHGDAFAAVIEARNAEVETAQAIAAESQAVASEYEAASSVFLAARANYTRIRAERDEEDEEEWRVRAAERAAARPQAPETEEEEDETARQMRMAAEDVARINAGAPRRIAARAAARFDAASHQYAASYL